jgi:phage terminase large subunit-like protein
MIFDPSVWSRAADLIDPARATDPAVAAGPRAGRARWLARARPQQLPPVGYFFVWLIMAGRGWGKTRTGAELFNDWARSSPPGSQLLLAGRTPADVRDYALYGEGGLLTHYPDIQYEPTKRVLTWPHRATALIRSGANPEEFRGFSGEKVWLDELASWDYPQECWDNLIFGMRERQPQMVITTTPRPIDLLRSIVRMPGTRVVRGSSYENRENLAPEWVTNVLDPLAGTRLGRQEIGGELIEDVIGALWTAARIEAARWPSGAALPVLERIVVAVDPQGSSTGDAPGTTGIVVAGRVARPPGGPAADGGGGGGGPQQEFVVLEDASMSGTPDEWGARAVAALDRWGADRVVAERNFGGEMVESTLRTRRGALPIEIVTASRGKIRRAEPIAALYEQARVHHRGLFARLEDEMVTFTPVSAFSPNRLDALVWALASLSGLAAAGGGRGGAWGRRRGPTANRAEPAAAAAAAAGVPRPAGWRPARPGAAAPRDTTVEPTTGAPTAGRGGAWGHRGKGTGGRRRGGAGGPRRRPRGGRGGRG